MNPDKSDGRPVTMQELGQHSRGIIALCPLPPRSRDVSARRGAACCAPKKTTPATADCLSVTSHESQVTSHQSLIARNFSQLKEKLRRSEEHTSELQSPDHLVCRLLLEKKKNKQIQPSQHYKQKCRTRRNH